METGDKIVFGFPDTPYYELNSDARKAINEAMEESVMLMSKRGTRQLKLPDGRFVDDLPEQEAKEWYEAEEVRILSKVIHYDQEFVERIMPEEYWSSVE